MNTKNQQGYIALISILIISAVTLLVATSASLLNISESNMGLAKNQAGEAYYLANACGEEALQRIRNSVLFSGNGDLLFDNGSCSYAVVKGAGENRIITASGIAASIIRKIKITVDKIKPGIHVASWQEVADF